MTHSIVFNYKISFNYEHHPNWTCNTNFVVQDIPFQQVGQ